MKLSVKRRCYKANFVIEIVQYIPLISEGHLGMVGTAPDAFSAINTSVFQNKVSSFLTRTASVGHPLMQFVHPLHLYGSSLTVLKYGKPMIS